MPDKSNSLPHTLQRSRLQIRPTRYGLVFILLLMGMLIGSLNYDNNPGYLLTFVLGSMAFVSIAQTYKNIAGLKILSAKTKPVFAGESARFEFAVEAAGIDRHGIAMALPEGKPVTLDTLKGTKTRIDVRVPAVSRGLLRPWPLSVYSDYPLGLFRVQSQLTLDLGCAVYPKPLIGKVKTLAESAAAETSGAFSGSGSDDFQGLKGYLPGDPLPRIYWKASSRGRGLFTKEYGGQYDAAFYLDWDLLSGPDAERKLSLMCHAVLKAQQHNLNYGLKLPGLTIGPGNGQVHKNRCLKSLALFRAD
jgi:uncharacterized protein (DUF58 family)